MDLTTRVIEGSGLSIPIFDGAHNNGKGRYLSEPEIIKNSLLEQMFEPEELQSLLLVKIDHRKPDANHLRARNFADGTSRRLTFSSGNSYYFADDDLRQKIRRLFATEPDTACRYGSLLVSNCYKGSDTLENLRVKIVDFDDPEYSHYKTGDCHGKISSQLARQLGGEQNCPFQFRFAWRKQWAEGSEENCPRVSFLSKGTLLPDARLTEAEGYDIIMDRSSIKGIKKARLDDLVPCGDYEFPRVAMGNRGNARATSYDNSWQFTIWYSEDAVRQDLKQPTEEKAKVLADLQRNPLALARYIVQEYDKEQQRRQERSEEEFEDEDGNANSQVQESRWISLLRSDKYGQLVATPKFRKFATDYVAGRWRDLAIKSGYSHSSGMAMPSDDLPRGMVCVPHLPEGDVILTRYRSRSVPPKRKSLTQTIFVSTATATTRS
ncbi:MAG: hypothetical protein KME27_19130 [Lyngbya sp. HA4199-MV5]|jgi:hypothetical protein|nr:hypothetical protein [Lyngbya sp. HA4199-MV5]